MRIKVIIGLITGLLLLVLILNINWEEFYNTIRNINVVFFILAFLVYICSNIVKTFRLKILLDSHINGFAPFLRVVIMHNFYTRIIPARLGEFSLIFLLKKIENTNYLTNASMLIIQRYYDLIFSGLFVCISIPFVFETSLLVFLSLLLGILLLIMLKYPHMFITLVKYFCKKVKLKHQFFKKFLNAADELDVVLSHIKLKRTRIALALLSLVFWILITAVFILLLRSINFDYQVFNIIFSSNLSNYSWALPINGVGGFGTMEISWALAFQLTGENFNQAIISGFFVNVSLFLMIVFLAFIQYCYMFLRYGRRFK